MIAVVVGSCQLSLSSVSFPKVRYFGSWSKTAVGAKTAFGTRPERAWRKINYHVTRYSLQVKIESNVISFQALSKCILKSSLHDKVERLAIPRDASRLPVYLYLHPPVTLESMNVATPRYMSFVQQPFSSGCPNSLKLASAVRARLAPLISARLMCRVTLCDCL